MSIYECTRNFKRDVTGMYADCREWISLPGYLPGLVPITVRVEQC